MTTTSIKFFRKDGSEFEVPTNCRFTTVGAVTTACWRGACERCGGLGGWSGWPGYTCYRCGGISSMTYEQMNARVYTEGQIKSVLARTEKAAAKKAEKAKAEQIARLADATAVLNGYGLADAIPMLDVTPAYDAPKSRHIIADILARLVRYGSMSEKQADLVGKLMRQDAEKAAEAAAAQPLPIAEGRMSIEGEVISTKWVDTQYGASQKMLIKSSDGWKVFGSVPRGLEVDRGTRVRFDAVVTPSADDASFGFFSRPTKATVIETAA